MSHFHSGEARESGSSFRCPTAPKTQRFQHLGEGRQTVEDTEASYLVSLPPWPWRCGPRNRSERWERWPCPEGPITVKNRRARTSSVERSPDRTVSPNSTSGTRKARHHIAHLDSSLPSISGRHTVSMVSAVVGEPASSRREGGRDRTAMFETTGTDFAAPTAFPPTVPSPASARAATGYMRVDGDIFVASRKS
jgi:hypothetical protein